MGRKSKPKYEKAMARLIQVGEMEWSLTRAYRAMMEWLEGVPWEFMTPEGATRFEEKVVEPAFEEVGKWFLRNRIIPEAKRKRLRPAYIKIYEHLIENYFATRRWDEIVELYELSPTELYRRVARETGFSWRTVRDAIWAAREALFG